MMTDEERTEILTQARASLDRLKDLSPRERNFESEAREYARRQQEVCQEPQASPESRNSAPGGVVYKDYDPAPVAPPAPAIDPHTAQYIFDVIGEVIGELRAQHQQDIAELRERLDVYTKMPQDLVAGARQMREQIQKVSAVLADIRAERNGEEFPTVN